MKLKALQVGPIGTNCYFLLDENTNKAAIVDPGDEADTILARFPLEGVEVEYILLTHGHYDHIGGTRALIEMYGVKTVIGRGDEDDVNGKLDLTWAKELGYKYEEQFTPDVLVKDGVAAEYADL